jgi:hypothetical protein
VLIALQRITADEFGKTVGLMRIGSPNGAHLMERDIHAAPGELPRGFGARKPSADNCDTRDQILS